MKLATLLFLLPFCLGAQATLSVPNDRSTGSQNSRLAKLSGSNVITATTSDTTNILGIVSFGGGKSGVAAVAQSGVASCDFDNSPVQGDYVVASGVIGGQCHDAGASQPMGVSVVGKVVATGQTQVLVFANSPVTAPATVPYRPNVVSDFHADRTGVADSSEQFQAAMTLLAIAGGQLYVPCGTYKLTSAAGMAAFYNHSTQVSMVGASKNCVTFNYVGAGRAFDWYTEPFTIIPYGELSGFTLNGTSSAQVGIYTGQGEGVDMHDFTVQGFTNGVGIEIVGDGNDVGNSPPGLTPPQGSFGERMHFRNINTTSNLTSWDFKLLNGDTNNSFAYSDYIGLHCNADEGQRCVYFEPGVYFGLNHFSITCNITAYNAGSVGPICVENAGLLHVNAQFDVLGEYDPGQGTGKPYALVNDSTGLIDNIGMNISVVGAGVLNLASTGAYPIRSGKIQGTFDQATYSINGKPGQVDLNWLAEDNGNIGGMGGNLGVIHYPGLVGSAFASISGLPGNMFFVCDSLKAYGDISTCHNLLEVRGDTHAVNAVAGPFENSGVPVSSGYTGSVSTISAGKVLVATVFNNGLRGLFNVTYSAVSLSRACNIMFTVDEFGADTSSINVLQNTCWNSLKSIGLPEVYVSAGYIYVTVTANENLASSGTFAVTYYGQDLPTLTARQFSVGRNTNVSAYQQYLPTGIGAKPMGLGTAILNSNAFLTVGGAISATGYFENLSTPSSSSATCTTGQFGDDANYHYVCVSTNRWKRVALSAF